MYGMRKIRFVALAVAALALSAAALAPAFAAAFAKEYIVYIGTFTNKEAKGIYAYRFNESTGEVSNIGLEIETQSPSFLAVHPGNKFLYAVNEIDEFSGQKAGAVSSYAIDRKTGKLTPLNQVSTKSPGPTHLAIDKTGKELVVANYSGGSVASFPVGSDGRLGEAASFDQHTGKGTDPERQESPHAHCAAISPDNRWAAVADLGLDSVFVYHLNPDTGTISQNSPPLTKVNPAAGPRHFAFHPNGKYAYVINEMQSTVTAFRWDTNKGTLTELQTISTLPQGFQGHSSTAEIQVHPNGRFLYGSNRGHDSIAVFSIDGQGKLAVVEHVPTQGKTPRGFSLDPTGHYLFAANQDSGTVNLFQVDSKTGRLKPTGRTMQVPTPVSVVFVPAR
jgi:6-phosphogluconolactonase